MLDEVYESTKDEHISLEEVIREIHDGVYKEGYEAGKLDMKNTIMDILSGIDTQVMLLVNNILRGSNGKDNRKI